VLLSLRCPCLVQLLASRDFRPSYDAQDTNLRGTVAVARRVLTLFTGRAHGLFLAAGKLVTDVTALHSPRTPRIIRN
jgi:hypothetical protein